MRMKSIQAVPLDPRRPLGDRAAMFVLVTIICMAGIAHQPAAGLTAGNDQQQALSSHSNAPVMSTARSRQSPARGTWATQSLTALLASHNGHQFDFENDDSGPTAALSHANALSWPAHAECLLLLVTHEVSECARRGLRTSGRHPPL